jgi:membrane protein YqaA with SNARE-associated domain
MIALNKRAYLTITGVTVTALVSGYLLLLLFTDNTRLEAMGLGGIFAASLLSHATMVARDIFLPLFLALTPFYHPVILGVSAGIGGAVGDVIPYLLGLGLAETVEDKGSRAEDLVGRWIKNYGLWAVLIVAMTPLPDLPVIMLAGTRRLPFAKLVLLEATGKTVLYSIGAFVGGRVFELLIGVVGSWAASIGMVVASILFSIALTWPPSRDWLFGVLDRLIPGRA